MNNTAYTLKNDLLTVSVSATGAELLSVVGADGCEYLWQGDPAFWSGRAPWLFPVCGRLAGEGVTYEGQRYELPKHGFARHLPFALTALSGTAITLTLTDTAATRALYPFAFAFSVTYRLEGNRMLTELRVENKDGKTLPFAIGAHPGFCAPINGKGRFEDCYLEFDEACYPDLILFSEKLLINGQRRAYPLQDGRFLPLSHPLFAKDALFFDHVAKGVTLRSRADGHFVTVSYGDFRYLGIWTLEREGADYVCIEPWNGLPSFDGEIEDLSQKPDMFRLLPNGEQSFGLCYTFG